jgi:hypothetical protein
MNNDKLNIIFTTTYLILDFVHKHKLSELQVQYKISLIYITAWDLHLMWHHLHYWASLEVSYVFRIHQLQNDNVNTTLSSSETIQTYQKALFKTIIYFIFCF